MQPVTGGAKLGGRIAITPFSNVAGCASDRRSSIIHLVLAQAEIHLIMIEIFQCSLTGVELAAVVVGMAAGAPLNLIDAGRDILCCFAI